MLITRPVLCLIAFCQVFCWLNAASRADIITDQRQIKNRHVKLLFCWTGAKSIDTNIQVISYFFNPILTQPFSFGTFLDKSGMETQNGSGAAVALSKNRNNFVLALAEVADIQYIGVMERRVVCNINKHAR